jgi:hypothetical protein
MIETATPESTLVEGIRKIAGYPRRNFAVRPGREPWEQEYHVARCLHAVAAEMVLELEGEDGIRQDYLSRVSSPTMFAPPANRGEAVAAFQIAGIARETLQAAGRRTASPITMKMPDEMREETFCAIEERFVPLVRPA